MAKMVDFLRSYDKNHKIFQLWFTIYILIGD